MKTSYVSLVDLGGRQPASSRPVADSRQPASARQDANRGVDDEESPLMLSDLQRSESKAHPSPSSPRLGLFKGRKALVFSSVAGFLVFALLIYTIVRIVLHSTPKPLPKVYIGPSDMAVTDQELTFFVVGDWGREGNASQLLAAKMMTDIAATHPPDFIISTGDNFYDYGLTGPNDPQLQTSFNNVYTAQSLQVPWYLVLGNHDYGDYYQGNISECSPLTATLDLSECGACCMSPMWQIPKHNPNLEARWNLPEQGAWSETFLDGRLLIVFIDTNPMITDYWKEPFANITGGILSQDTAAQKEKVKSLLSAAKDVPWKLVVGHHPINSYGHHCLTSTQCDDMQWLKPLLDKYKVSAYFSGHEHDLQLIKKTNDPLYYIVSGAGSDIREDDFSFQIETVGLGSHFFAADQGFVMASIKGDLMTLNYFTAHSANVSHTVHIARR